jgi:hypothetical protein
MIVCPVFLGLRAREVADLTLDDPLDPVRSYRV